MRLKVKLVEDFSPSIPGWLKKELESNKSLKTIIANRGIDLNNLTFTPSLPPATANAISKFPSDYQQVYLLNSGNNWRNNVVYLPGINNPEVSWDSTDKWKEKAIEKWPRKQLLKNVIEFGYIDLTNPENTSLKLQSDRASTKRDMIKRGTGQYPSKSTIYAKKEDGYNDYDNVIGTTTNWYTTKGQDKSGYMLDPDKYKKILNNVNLNTYGQRLQSFYNRLNLIRDNIKKLDNSIISIDDIDKYDRLPFRGFSNNVFEMVSRIYSNFASLISTYNRLCKNCERIANKDNLSEEEKNKNIQWEFDFNALELRKDIESLEKDIKNLIESITQINNNNDGKVGDKE